MGIVDEFRSLFGGAPRLFRAPGRVNLIGDHTDYNDGFVMPAALEFSTWAAAAARADRTLRIRSVLKGETLAFGLDDPAPTPRRDWSDYVRGVAVALKRAGHPLVGADLLIATDVPIGAGLSSSAAIEVAVGFALLELAGETPDRVALARQCQWAENEFVGMRCGIMDQFIACNGAAGYALMIDCRSLAGRRVRIDPAARVLVCNTMAHHELTGSEYNVRRADCEAAVARLSKVLPGIRALRDVTAEQLDAHAALLTETMLRRARHVITENDRVVRAADAFDAGNLALCGRLMLESHASLRDDYETSCEEADIMVALAEKIDGAYGARITGGGFGGSVVALVRADAAERFGERLAREYRDATGLDTKIFACSPGDGASEVAIRRDVRS